MLSKVAAVVSHNYKRIRLCQQCLKNGPTDSAAAVVVVQITKGVKKLSFPRGI